MVTLENMADILRNGISILKNTNSDLTFFESIVNTDFFGKVIYNSDQHIFNIQELKEININKDLVLSNNSSDFWSQYFIKKEELSTANINQSNVNDLLALLSKDFVNKNTALNENKIYFKSINLTVNNLSTYSVLNFKALKDLKSCNINDTFEVDISNYMLKINFTNNINLESDIHSKKLYISNLDYDSNIISKKITSYFDKKILDNFIDKKGQLAPTTEVPEKAITNMLIFRDIEKLQIKKINDKCRLINTGTQKFEDISQAIDEYDINEDYFTTNIIVTKGNLDTTINKLLTLYI